MTILDAILLGLVEGITEFLPISSTGHMVLTTTLLGIQETDFVKTFIIVIQLGAILAAAVLYWRRLLLDRRTLVNTIVAFIPTGIIGFVVYKAVKGILGNPAIVVATLLLGGIALLVIEWGLKRRAGRQASRPDMGAATAASGRPLSEMSVTQAAIIGTCQAISMIPGVSRSATTIVAGLLLGLNRQAIVEFSFVLAIPTMAAATAYEIYKTGATMTFEQIDLLVIGFVVAFVLALAAIKFLLRFVQTHTFNAFGVYRIVAAVLFWLVVLR